MAAASFRIDVGKYREPLLLCISTFVLPSVNLYTYHTFLYRRTNKLLTIPQYSSWNCLQRIKGKVYLVIAYDVLLLIYAQLEIKLLYMTLSFRDNII